MACSSFGQKDRCTKLVQKESLWFSSWYPMVITRPVTSLFVSITAAWLYQRV